MKNVNTQLNNLKGIRPNRDFKNKNRELLLTQIYNTPEIKPADFTFSPFLYIREFTADLVNIASQPAMAVGLIFLFLFSGGMFGALASRGTKPGDSLYIAKLVSEKTQLALTFGEKEKAQLRIDFAGNRVEEIDQVLADNKQNEAETKKTVDNLVDNVKKEVGAAKTGLQKISKNAKIDVETENKEVENAIKASSSKVANVKKEEDDVFSANLGKEKAGISTSEKADADVVKKDTENTVDKKVEDSQELLTQAKESLKSDDVVKTLSVLEKVDEAIDKRVDGSGEVKGISEEASSSVEVKQ